MTFKFSTLMAVAFCALSAWAAPVSNQPAPDFTAKGIDGKTYKLSEMKGKTVVLEWFNKDCPYVRKFYDAKVMQELQKGNTSKGVVWLSIVSSAPGKEGSLDTATAEKLRKEKGMGNTTIILDSKGELGKLYAAKTTPHVFVIDKTGVLVYQGAVDDKPSANAQTLKDAHSYLASALTAVTAADAKTPIQLKDNSTTPYGCSVKY